MTIDSVPTAQGRGLDRVNPVAKLLASLLVAVVLVLTIDWVSSGVALALELILFAVVGVGWLRFWRRTWFVWLAAVLGGITIALYGQPSGQVHAEWLLVRVTDGSLELAAATVLRILAIGLPAVVLFARVDPTDLADGLAQVLRLPARFVVGALAAFRLVALFAQDWRTLALARRARGVADQGRARRFAGLAFATFVLALRRGSDLATAMEARGFGGRMPRSWARPSRFAGPEVGVVLVAAAVAAIAATAAIVTGHWTFIVR